VAVIAQVLFSEEVPFFEDLVY